MTTTPPHPPLDQITLLDPVRRALGSATAEIGDWRCQPIPYRGAVPSSGGLYRISGIGHDRGTSVSWSLVLKIAQAGTGTTNPADPYYWKREPLVYQSGLLNDLPSTLAAPRCFGVMDYTSDTNWLWLEEVADDCGLHWPLPCYATAARHLGHFNGSYLAGQPLPSHPCLSQGWLAAWIAFCAPAVDHVARVPDDPLVRQAYPGLSWTRFLHLWGARGTLLADLARLPQTFCHLDAMRSNLFVRRINDAADQIVAIDWAFAGMGALGEDLAALVAGSIFFEDEQAAAQDIDELTFAAYIEGLRDVGWRGDPEAVRFAYTASVALRYGPSVALLVYLARDPGRRDWLEQAFSCSLEQLMDRLAGLLDFVLIRTREAQNLQEALH